MSRCGRNYKKYNSITPYQKRNFIGASTNRRFIGISMLNAKVTILKKINISFKVHFSLSKYSFSLNTFWTYFVCITSFSKKFSNILIKCVFKTIRIKILSLITQSIMKKSHKCLFLSNAISFWSQHDNLLLLCHLTDPSNKMHVHPWLFNPTSCQLCAKIFLFSTYL